MLSMEISSHTSMPGPGAAVLPGSAPILLRTALCSWLNVGITHCASGTAAIRETLVDIRKNLLF